MHESTCTFVHFQIGAQFFIIEDKEASLNDGEERRTTANQ